MEQTTGAKPRGAALIWSLAALVVLAWGGNYALQKDVMAQIGPSPYIVARYLATPFVMACVLTAQFGWRWPKLRSRDWLALCGLALLGHVAHVSVMTHAMHLSTPFSSALISACGPVFTLLILRLMTSNRLEHWQVAGVALAAAGVLVFMSDKLVAGPTAQTAGDVMLLVGTVLFSSHTVVARETIERLGVFVFMAYCTILASVPMILLNAGPAAALEWHSLSGTQWVQLAATLAASLGGWLTWSWLSVELGVAKTAPLLYLLPPVAGVIAWSTVGETFGASKVAGSVIALAGVALVQFGGRLLPARD
jgi:drug/metabolite transporter (DMT)-like permease